MDAIQPILGSQIRNCRTPQQLQELSRRVQAEINSASVTLQDGVYHRNARNGNPSQSTPSRAPRPSQLPSRAPRPSQLPNNYHGPWQDEFQSHGPSMQWDNGAHNGAAFSSQLQGNRGRVRNLSNSEAPHSNGRQGRIYNSAPPEYRSDNPDWRRGRPSYPSGLPNLDRLNLRTEHDRQNDLGNHHTGGRQHHVQGNDDRDHYVQDRSHREQNRSSTGSRHSDHQNATHDRNNESHRGYQEQGRSNDGSRHAGPQDAAHARNDESHRARQGDYSRNNSSLNDDDDDLMNVVYNLYGAPLDYRQRAYGIPSGAPPAYRTNQWDEPNCSVIHPCDRSNQSAAMPIWQFRGPELKLTPFSGVSEEFYDWMPTFRAQVDSYPEQLKVSTLRENLDPESKAFVAYISDSDPGAYERIWEELERRCNLGVANHHRYIGKLLVLVNSPPVRDVKGLEHVYNTLNYSWAKLCGLGARYAGYAEPILPLLSNILFDKSQKAVDDLTGTVNLTVPNVLDAIWKHMSQLRKREHNQKICAPYNPNPVRPYSSRQVPSRFHNQRSGGAQLMKTSAGTPTQDSGASSFPSSDLNRRTSPDRSRDSSPTRRNPSPTRYRSPASSPNRLRSGSPSAERRRHFRCSMCEVDDHSHLDCTKFSPKEQFQICKSKRLCFGCRAGGHPASLCPFTSLLCADPACNGYPPHADIFCQFAREQ